MVCLCPSGIVQGDPFFNNWGYPGPPLTAIENTVMADTFSHIISLQFFGQMSGDGKRCLGLTQTRNIVPLPLHGKRSEEHTSELQSLMRISYAVFCLKQKKT